MKKLLIILLFLAASVYPAGRGELLEQFRARTGEPDENSSFYPDSVAYDWLNKAIQRVARLSFSYHTEDSFAYTSTANVFEIPTTRGVRAILAKVGNRWYDITGDREALSFSVTRVDSLISRVYVQVGGFVQRRTKITYSEDSTSYRLPADFGRLTEIMARVPGDWKPVVENPGFRLDTRETTEAYATFYVAWAHVDTAFLYLKSDDLVHGDDTLIVHYLAGPVTGDSIRISYFAQPPLMTSTDSTCVLDDDLEGFVLEEAESYYYDAIREYQGAAQMRQNVRQDLGGQ